MGLIHTAKILAGRSNGERYNFIVDEIQDLQRGLTWEAGLQEKGINPVLTYHLESCVEEDPDEIHNASAHKDGLVNIIIPSGKPKVIGVCCNYDAPSNSDGANDNASSVAVMLNLIDRFHQVNPKTGQKLVQLANLGVEFYLVCNGASNMLGSKELAQNFQNYDGSTPLVGMYNLKMTGIGDRVIAWPVNAGETGPLLTSLRAAIQQHNSATGSSVKGSSTTHHLSNNYDYKSFCGLGVESFCVSATTREDLDAMKSFYEAVERANPAEIVRHTDTSIFLSAADTSDKLSEATLQMVSDIMFRAIVTLDANYPRVR